MICDCCGENWEEAFFCERCSRLATDERLGEDDGYAMDVCGNCCMCHYKEPAAVDRPVVLAGGDDVPF